MIDFQNFPITIVYSLHRQQTITPLWNQFYAELKGARRNALRNLLHLNIEGAKRSFDTIVEKENMIAAAMQWQLIEDLEYKYKTEIREYEKTMERTLITISKTSIGKKLLNLLNPAEKVWIIPPDWDEATATTDRLPDAAGGQVVIKFDPKSWRKTRTKPDQVEDTVVHELVHALRISWKRFLHKRIGGSDFGSSEEFIATQIENIYRSSRGTNKNYSAYRGDSRNKKDMYQYLVEHAELIMALKFFLKDEPLAQYATNLNQPDYNPFRDFKELEARSLKLFGVDKFMDF
jgi:hypothetical protein